MDLRERLRAGLRVTETDWARDLARLYGVRPGETLVLTVRRPAGGNELELDVQAPRPASVRTGRLA